MISDELSNFKPYAVPVRVIKYKSITDAMLREFKEELRKAMKECGMTTVGTSNPTDYGCKIRGLINIIKADRVLPATNTKRWSDLSSSASSSSSIR